MTDTEKKKIAQVFLTAMRTKDWEPLISVLASNATWSMPGTSKISGIADGAEAVIRRAQIITSHNLTFTLKHVLTGESGVAVSLNNTARRGDFVFDADLATVMRLREGKITALDTYFSDVEMVNAFFV